MSAAIEAAEHALSLLEEALGQVDDSDGALSVVMAPGGGSYPVYPHDGDQVPFDLVQHPVRADAQPAVGTAEERARRRRIVS